MFIGWYFVSLSTAPAKPPDGGARDHNHSNQGQVTVDQLNDYLPILAQIIAQCQKDRHPENPARICVRSEGSVPQFGHAGNQGREMAHAQNEVSEREQPMT